MDEIRLMGIGLVGAGFSVKAFKRGLEMQPHMIGSDGGTSDMGPYHLGSGELDRRAIRRDLKILIEGARSIRVPLIVGSIGTAGGGPQVQAAREIVHDIARECGLNFRLATLHADLSGAQVKHALAAGKVSSFGPVPALSADDVDRSNRIVGMMGAEPFMAALEGGADIIIAGRATDPAIFAGPPLLAGFDAGMAWHAARTIDKGVLMTEPVTAGSCAFIHLHQDHFIASPTRAESVCTPTSVAAIGIYENDNPFKTGLPSGTLETSAARFEAIDHRQVRVSGARFEPAAQYTVKLEGTAPVGERAVVIIGIRDPVLISQLGVFLERVRNAAARNLELMGIARGNYQLRFRVYGLDGVMGPNEPMRAAAGHEVGIVVEAIAPDAEIAASIVRRAASVAQHVDYEGRLTRSGNAAYPFSGKPLAGGTVYEWSVWHLMQVQSWRDAARVELEQI